MPVWPVASTLDARNGVQTHMTLVSEECE